MRRQKGSGGQKSKKITYPETGRNATGKKRKPQRQRGGFLNRYEFAYAGRDVVNQVGKIAPNIINQTTGQINKIAQDRIDQIIRCVSHQK